MSTTENSPPPGRQDDLTYRRAVTPGLRKLLVVLVLMLAPLGANSVYLAAITFLGHVRGQSFENQFYLWMFLLHLVLGFLLIVPLGIFAVLHVRNVIGRRSRRVLNAGWRLLAVAIGVLVTGIVMTLRPFGVDTVPGRITYWLHVSLPVLCTLFYISHRLLGPAIRWRWGAVYTVSVGAFTAVMVVLHGSDPRVQRGGGEAYFKPAEARTFNLGLIPAETLMMDHYCLQCHPDAVEQHEQSVHRLSSFNNPVYLFSVRETREILMERDGSVRGARFCAGCHDPVPLFTGAFDDPGFDDVGHPTARVGITCTVCHSITQVNGTVGNGNYTIEEALHYPFAYSDSTALKWVNEQLVKAKPAFHKRTFLKPLHESAEFCAVCHKVNIPGELNGYKEWLRGQNHYDNFLLSGVSGHGARSFYYPQQAHADCNGCHMPLIDSDDLAAQGGKTHDHRFPGANTAMPFLLGLGDQARFQRDFLEDGQMDIDIFALRAGGTIDGKLIGPIRPGLPSVEPGKSYLLEVVLRTMNVGHDFTQGTTDSNEVWIAVEARQDGCTIGRSGAIDEQGNVDRWAHFVNTFMLDRHGNRIDRRNVQDIFVPLYNHQMPPGTGQVVHYRLDVPPDARGAIDVEVKLNYRKFDRKLMGYVDEGVGGVFPGMTRALPVAVMASDRVRLPVKGADAGQETASNASATPRKPPWQRWRDYGIGLLLKGDRGSNKGQLKQAQEAFAMVAELGRAEGWVDLARSMEKEGRLDDARSALARAVEAGYEATWVVNWFSGVIEMQYGNYPAAISLFEKVLDTRVPERGFDFSRDYVVRNELGRALLLSARAARGAERERLGRRAIEVFESVLALDSENLTAHHNLMLCHRLRGDADAAARHRRLHEKYRPDENARDRAVATVRGNDPAADHAAESVVIYDLAREIRER